MIGLTGNIASGKSTVLAYLRRKGAHVIDADKLTHRSMQPGGPAYDAIVSAFGRDILADDGSINRAALGSVVFADANALRRVEEIVHPAVFELAKEELAQTTAPVVVVEAIKLLEAKRLVTLCQEVWVVTSDPDVQMRRLLQERGMSETEARQRMAAQSSQADKVKQATRVIANNGSIQALYEQLDAAWNELMAANED